MKDWISGDPTLVAQILDALFNEQNQSPDDQTTVIPATFLRVTVEA